MAEQVLPEANRSSQESWTLANNNLFNVVKEFGDFFNTSTDVDQVHKDAPPQQSPAADANDTSVSFVGFLGELLGAPAPESVVPAAAETHHVQRSDETFDRNERYRGTVEYYSKLKGYGFITLDKKDIVPKDTVYVHWENVESNDRFAFLRKGMEVEFNIMVKTGLAGYDHRASCVTNPGGERVTVQDKVDTDLKTFVGGKSGKELRYTGTLKFFDPKKGYGYISLDSGYQIGLDGSEIRVERAEVNAGGAQPLWMSNLAVEFGIWATTKGALKAFNMTLPGGIPLTQAALENRVVHGSQLYTGEIQVYNWKQGWGMIKVDDASTLPASVDAKLLQQAQKSAEKYSWKSQSDSSQVKELLYFRKVDIVKGQRLDVGAKVIFQVYTDDKGAGAQQLRLYVADAA